VTDLNVDADEARFLDLVGAKLGATNRNRFRAAHARPSWLLRDRVLRPNLFRCEPGRDLTECTYYPVALVTETPGRNHELAQRVAAVAKRFSADEVWSQLTYFANALRACAPEWDEASGRDEWQAPSERVVGRHHVFTFEFGVPDIGFLREQMSWLKARKKPSDSPMGRLFARLSGYADFAGLTVSYGGNKSLHIHAAFETRLACETLHLDAVADPRTGFAAHWDLLRPTVREALGVPEGVEPDAHLRCPEAYRRMPNAYRLVEDDGHVLGVPPGTWVRQVTLWEQWRERAAANTTAILFRPDPFHQPPRGDRARRRSDAAASAVGGDLTPEQAAFCEQRLREHFGDWPKLHSLRQERGRWIARFYNSPDDRGPGSVLREDFKTIHLVGTGAEGLYPRPLPFPLWRMIRFWAAEFDRRRRAEAVPEEEVVASARPRTGGDHPLEVAFREAARDSDAARAAAERFVLDAVPGHLNCLIRGAEGLGKSSSLFSNHHLLIERIQEADPHLSMYAFADYETAASKCQQFNAAQLEHGFVGILIQSFSKAYERACADLRLAPMTQVEAARRGHSSLWAGVKALQPRVMDAFRAMHAEARRPAADGARPVFFSVHQVMHEWANRTPTRAMWSPSYWRDDGEDEAVRRRRAFEETELALAVHDEVRVESLVELRPRAVLDWLRRLTASGDGGWRTAGLDRQFALFEAFAAAEGMPRVDGRAVEMGFDEVRRLAALAEGAWTFVTTRDTGEYVVEAEAEAGRDGDREDIYAARHGREWAVHTRGWWQGLAAHVVVLTTEALPTAVARRADPDGWSVFELDASGLPRGTVEVHAIRGVTAANLAALCGEWRHRLGLPDAWVVSNRAAGLPRSTNHALARGSNDLIGQHVIQTMAFMAPDEYERIQALNAWTGRSDLCLLRHIDEFNQTAGRNLGFRGREGVRHHLLVNPRLFALILEARRYDVGHHIRNSECARMPLDGTGGGAGAGRGLVAAAAGAACREEKDGGADGWERRSQFRPGRRRPSLRRAVPTEDSREAHRVRSVGRGAGAKPSRT
jgi:hypothetical protein